MCSPGIKGLASTESGEEVGPEPGNVWMGGKYGEPSRKMRIWTFGENSNSTNMIDLRKKTVGFM